MSDGATVFVESLYVELTLRNESRGKSGVVVKVPLLEGDAAWGAAGESGGGGIRTPGQVAPSPVFKTGALNRSATPPADGPPYYNGIPHLVAPLFQAVRFSPCITYDPAKAPPAAAPQSRCPLHASA